MEQLVQSESKPLNGDTDSGLPKYTPRVVQRLTVVETLYHQNADDAVAYGHPYTRLLNSDEQPYVRTLKATPDWMEFGQQCWVSRACVLRLENMEGKVQLITPTKIESEALKKRVLEVAIVAVEPENATMHDPPNDPVTFAIVRPGESMRFEPQDIKRLRVRCPAGVAKFQIVVLPE